MKRFAIVLAVLFGLSLSSNHAQASWGHTFYSGYQPWYNIFAKRYKCLTPEEERLQKFWHDYYDALRNFYAALDHVDWVAYYKNHGYVINAGGPGGCCGRINYAPVFVNPTLQWAVPANAAGGPPMGPPMGGMGAMGGSCGPMGGYPMGGMPMFPMGPYGPGPMPGAGDAGPLPIPAGTPSNLPMPPNGLIGPANGVPSNLSK
jgi:hypothetical protein